MNIVTIIANLDRTIAGKEMLLAEQYPDNPYSGNYLDEDAAGCRRTAIQYLRINIDELKRIRRDLKAII